MTTLSSSMTSQRRAEIRELLTEQVARDTATVEAANIRLRRPALRWQPRLRPLAAGAVVMAAAAAVFVATDVRNPPASFATWTAVPATAPGAPVSDDQIHQWASKCSSLGEDGFGVGGIGIQGVPAGKAEAARRDVLVDRRGIFTYCVDVALGSGTAQDPLVALSGISADTGPDPDDVLSTAAGTVYDKPVRLPHGHDILVLGGDREDPFPATEDEDPTITYLRAYQLYGLAGPDVDSVKIVLANGRVVTATLQRGLWGAWWPAEEGTPSGARLQITSGTHSTLVNPRKVALLPG
jgi:hypothetical protein